jgi:bifunctional non-homologous end joining protein LigD
VKSKPAASARLPDFVEPMKAKLVGSMPSGGDWIYEIKFDGYQALALRGGSKRASCRGTKRIWAANSQK